VFLFLQGNFSIYAYITGSIWTINPNSNLREMVFGVKLHSTTNNEDTTFFIHTTNFSHTVIVLFVFIVSDVTIYVIHSWLIIIVTSKFFSRKTFIFFFILRNNMQTLQYTQKICIVQILHVNYYHEMSCK